MDLIYTDAGLTDAGVLLDYTLDIDLAGSCDFEICVDPENPALSIGCCWYIDGTEYGGRVDGVKVDTDASELTYKGRSWRGMLASKVVSPPAGEAYLTVSGAWQTIVQALLEDCGLSELFAADSVPVAFDACRVNRYVTLLDALTALLAGKNYRLSLIWANGKVHVGGVPIRDLTDTVQYETGDRVHLVVEDSRGGVNHLICLGQGEGAAREVIHLYTTETGGITELEQTYTGLNEIADVYDDSSARTREELKSGGINRLRELQSRPAFSVSVQDLDLQIGDIIGGKESITGLKVAEPVTNIIFRIDSEGVPSIEYKVGERE